MDCFPPKLFLALQSTVGANYTINNKSLDQLRCDDGQLDELKEDLKFYEKGLDFYAYVTPFIVIIGVFGNAIILAVFLSKPMRKMSASLYLISLAFSDGTVLLTYVLIEWLQKGLYQWPVKHTLNLLSYNGFCETFLFITYGFRFMSVWLIVIFTLERYIGVCHPLQRRGICTNNFAKKAIVCIFLGSCLVSLYKPIISDAKTIKSGKTICTGKEEYKNLNFILDIVYALLITAVPFAIITTFNILITRTLLLTRRRQKRVRFCSDDTTNKVKLEFTFLLLVVSTCFIALNLPYFVVWCLRLYNQISGMNNVGNHTSTGHLRGTLYICKTIFSFNYCINFFLYSLTGVNFRKQLFVLFCRKKIANVLNNGAGSKTIYSRISLTLTSATPRQSLSTNGMSSTRY